VPAGSDISVRVLGASAVICSSLSLQLSATIATTVFDNYGPLGAASLRLAVGALLLVIVFPIPLSKLRREWQAPLLFGLGLIGVNGFGYLAIQRIPLATAVTVMLLGPLSVALAGSRRAVDAGWVGLATVGVVMIVGWSDEASWLGVCAALGAAASAAAYLLLLRRLGDTWSGLQGLTAGLVIAALLTLPLSLLSAVDTPDLDTAAAAISLGVLGAVVPFCAEFWAAKVLSLRVVGVLFTIDPVVAAALGFWLLNQTLGARELLGIACVVIAAAATTASVGAVRRLHPAA
jgi:inner membrane transporter RhtA